MTKLAKKVFGHNEHRCFYCGESQELTMDHVLPRSRGGHKIIENLKAACKSCNNVEKGDMTIEEYRDMLAIRHIEAMKGMLPLTSPLALLRSAQQLKFFGELPKQERKGLVKWLLV